MNSKPAIAFFGTPRLAQIVLSLLIDSPYKPNYVVTQPDKKVGRGQKISSSPVKKTAIQNKIEVFESLKKLPSFDLGILVAFGKILPKEILNVPKHGFINIHPSLLPKCRGPSPIQSALLEGEEKTGVTIIKLDEEVDHGPILAKRELPIEKNDTHESLIEKLGDLGSKLLIEILPDYLEDKIKPQKQNHRQATFTKRIEKKDGLIDLLNPPNPLTLDGMIRAYYPWPNVWTQLTHNSKLITIKLLPSNLIQPEGKRPMTIKEFLNGYPKAAGAIENLLSPKK